MKGLITILVAFITFSNCFATAAGTNIPLQRAHIDLQDKASLQRGAKLFMNYCSGCHSLQYMRYKRLAKDIGIENDDGEFDKTMFKENLIFTGASINDMVHTAMRSQDARQWFGINPPDLTLIARIRGVDWLVTYLKSFYQDNSRPWGANNWLFPDVAMPNILNALQGEQSAVYRTEVIQYAGKSKKIRVIDHLQRVVEGKMTEHEFDSSINDIVNFLAYTGEPVQLTRRRIGFWVLLFLGLFSVLAYLLKKEYWKDIQ